MRPEKANIVAELAEKMKRSPFVLVADYQRMNVGHFGELRNRLMPVGAEMHVVKNSFLKRAMADSGFPDVGDKLTGQTAVVTGEKDVAPVAKILKAFAAEFKTTALKMGLIDRAVVSTADVEALADLPSREVLLAQLLGLFLAPATRLVRVLNEPASAFARLLNAKAGQGEPASASKEEAPVAVAETKDAPVAEATPEPPAVEAQEEAPKNEVNEPAATALQETPAAEPKAETPPAEAKKEEPPATEAAG
ncbi:MAG TPA: 50S ribosomal protein L10 [Chthoniobacterales bacterium]|nr:50S ribosomal protein L10 [Chthoniobacterales bacterium]